MWKAWVECFCNNNNNNVVLKNYYMRFIGVFYCAVKVKKKNKVFNGLFTLKYSRIFFLIFRI